MKIKTALLITTSLLTSSVTSLAFPASATPQEWNGCVCDSPVVLSNYTFDGSQIDQAITAAGINATSISGPGNLMANNFPGSPSGNFGCFDGFPANGDTGTIGFSLTNNSAQDYCLNNITFDYFAEGTELGQHGPEKFAVRISSGGNLLWETETLQAGIGSANVQSFSMIGTLGTQFVSDADLYEFFNGESITVEIVAGGANNSTVGFDVDNVQVHACPVPEPSSSLLVLLGSAFVLVRRKR